MTTIKLKDPVKKGKEKTYTAGQMFKCSRGICILSRTDYTKFSLIFICNGDSYLYDSKQISGKTSLHGFDLTKLNTFFNLDLTPINVTISED